MLLLLLLAAASRAFDLTIKKGKGTIDNKKEEFSMIDMCLSIMLILFSYFSFLCTPFVVVLDWSAAICLLSLSCLSIIVVVEELIYFIIYALFYIV
jgi:hypothetical protein